MLLMIEQITKSFGGLFALNECSFDVKKDSITGLIGPNGSGKTTLFDIITGFYRPDKGKIFFKNRDISNMKPYKIMQQGIVRTFQITRVFPGLTVMGNMLYSPKNQCGEKLLNVFFSPIKIMKQDKLNRGRAEELLEIVGLAELGEEYAGHLSYGQQKLLELARALITNPDVILLDEPAAGVNPTILKKISKVIYDLNRRGKTFLIIEHNMKFIMEIAHKIVVLNYGKKIVENSPDCIQRDPEVIKAYLGTTYDFDS